MLETKCIPVGWEVTTLGKVCTFLDGKRKPIKESDRAMRRGIYPYYGASGIIDYVDNFIFDEELILLGEDGANILNRSTPLAFKVSGKIWVNNHAHVLRPNQDMDIGFLTEYLESLKYDKYNTGTAQPKLNKEVCSSIEVIKPPFEEQRAIGTIFSTWDNGIEKLQQLIAAKQKRKKALMQQLLTGKKRFKEFTDEWQEVTLGDVFNRVTRKNTDANTNVLTISAQKGLINQEHYFNKQVASETLDNYFLLRKGEFAYNKSYSNGYPMGAIKRLKYYEAGVVTTLYICFGLKNESKHSPEFMEHYFNAGFLNRELKKIAHEGGRAHGLLNVTPVDFFNLKLSIPDFREQQKIASVLQAADKEIEVLQQKLNALKQQKKGLVQKLLTGQVRVNLKAEPVS